MSIDAAKEIYEHIELFGKPALFSNFRIDKGTVPQELYCYDLRGSDNDPGIPISLERSVAINHAGCIIIAENIDLSDKGYIRIKGKLNFLGEHLSISDFCERYAICNKERVQIQPAANSDAGIFFAQTPEKDEQMGAIGHVRIDFGKSGTEFWHTWFPRGDESLNSASFKAELTRVVDQLRESVLKDLRSMSRFCYENGGAIDGGWRQNYGYIVETDSYKYCLRCSPGQGDYHAYLTCFDMNVQRANIAKEKGVLAQLADNKTKIQAKTPEPKKDTQKGKSEVIE